MSGIGAENANQLEPLSSWNFDSGNRSNKTCNLRTHQRWRTNKIRKDSSLCVDFEDRLQTYPKICVLGVVWPIWNQVFAHKASHLSYCFGVGVVADFLNKWSQEFFIIKWYLGMWAKMQCNKRNNRVGNILLTTLVSRIVLIAYSAATLVSFAKNFVSISWL